MTQNIIPQIAKDYVDRNRALISRAYGRGKYLALAVIGDDVIIVDSHEDRNALSDRMQFDFSDLLDTIIVAPPYEKGEDIDRINGN